MGQESSNQIEFSDMVELGKSMNLQVGDFRNFVDKLNANGIILKKSAKLYQILWVIQPIIKKKNQNITILA